MSDVTIKSIEELLDRTLDTKLEPIKVTLESHTTSLEQLVTKKKTRDDEAAVAVFRFSRLEKWDQKIGEKLGIKFEV